jgi:hypothetical protein
MTNQEILDSGATGSYAATTFQQGVSTFPGYAIAFRAGGVLITAQWAKPNSEKTVQDFIRKHGGTPKREKDFAYG